VGVSCIYVNNRKKSLKIHKKKDKRTNNDLYKNYAETRKSLKILMWVIRTRKQKRDRQYNCDNNKDKRTNSDLQNTTQKPGKV
jgi:capsular polysaccharide biosynthesis protein